MSAAEEQQEFALQVEQYTSVILSGQLSLGALKRIIKHDAPHLWDSTPGGKARIAVAKACDDGLLTPAKLVDEVGDRLYGKPWPLPLTFTKQP